MGHLCKYIQTIIQMIYQDEGQAPLSKPSFPEASERFH